MLYVNKYIKFETKFSLTIFSPFEYKVVYKWFFDQMSPKHERIVEWNLKCEITIRSGTQNSILSLVYIITTNMRIISKGTQGLSLRINGKLNVTPSGPTQYKYNIIQYIRYSLKTNRLMPRKTQKLHKKELFFNA